MLYFMADELAFLFADREAEPITCVHASNSQNNTILQTIMK